LHLRAYPDVSVSYGSRSCRVNANARDHPLEALGRVRRISRNAILPCVSVHMPVMHAACACCCLIYTSWYLWCHPI
jgi:hypothetical protein